MTTTFLQPYEVPLVYYDLTPPLTIEDTLHALQQLSYTVDVVFNKINVKLNSEKEKITKINERVGVCSGKINSVRGSNKATTVFSTAKFPAPKKLIPRPTLFSINEDVPTPFPEAVDDIHYTPPLPSTSLVNNKELSTEIHQMQSKLNSYGTDMLRSEFIMEDQGLGRIPTTVRTVGSILLFNSDTNPYKNYQALDNLVSTGRTKAVEDDVTRALASAPSTLISGEALPDIAALDLTYKPQMGELSALALPSNLPLDFLADIHFDGAALPSIAPSAHRGAADYSLPQITDGTTTGSAFSASSQYAPPPSAKQPPPAPSSAPPPPPSSAPPPPPSSAPPPPPPSSAPPPPPPSSAPPPPPPQASAPPPPPPTANIGDIDEGDDNSSPAPGGRSSLLDAIKGMNVSKLRSKEEAQVAAAKTQRAVEASKPVSMMDEMRLRMQRRNNAISGKSSREQTKNDSMLFKPPTPSAATSEPTKTSISKVFKAADDDESDAHSDISDAVSEVSVDSVKKPAAPLIPPPPQRPKAPEPAASAPPPPQQARRGSLLDASNPTVASLLNNAKSKANSDSDESENEDDWD